MKSFFLTSESVSEGHPDKVADQISDAVLDEFIEQDKDGRVAAETLVRSGLVILARKITTSSQVNSQKIVHDVILSIGYTKMNTVLPLTVVQF